MAHVVIGNFKSKNKYFNVGDVIHEKGADGKPVFDAKEIAHLEKENLIVDQKLVSQKHAQDLEKKIASLQNEAAKEAAHLKNLKSAKDDE